MDMSEHNINAPKPLPSATVVLVREGTRAPEVFLVHRHARTSFGASYVFPGGLLEPGDCKARAWSGGVSAAAADRCLELSKGGLDYYSAAIRELFEETGVLLARHGNSERYPDDLVAARGQLNAGELLWPEFLQRHDLALACESLHYFAYWITPRNRPKRFSTRFFMARLPDGRTASHDGAELTDSRWTTAADAVAASKAGELKLPHPTLATLNDIADYRNVDELLAWARQRSDDGVQRILPAIVSSGGRDRVVMPGHPDYPQHADRGEQ